MATIQDLLDHIENIPQADLNAVLNSTQSSFVGFLRNIADLEAPFSQSVLIEYVRLRMIGEGGLKQTAENTNALMTLLLMPALSKTVMSNIDLQCLAPFLEIESVSIDHATNRVALVRKQALSNALKRDQVRVFEDESGRTVALRLFADGDLELRTYSKAAYIQSGGLSPLWRGHWVQYDNHLELKRHSPHYLRLSHSHIGVILRDDSEFLLKVIRIPSFELEEVEVVHSLEESPLFFSEIKRLEKYFVDRTTDPFYQELTRRLEVSIEKLRLIGKDYTAKAAKDLGEIQRAVEEIFTGDKLLMLLLREFESEIHSVTKSETKADQIASRSQTQQIFSP